MYVSVYRVEGPDGVGPYQCERSLPVTAALAQIPGKGLDNHPPPWLEGIRMSSNQVCGFESMESADSWFSRHVLMLLARSGFATYRYEVPADTVRYGQKQVVFDKSLAVSVSRAV